MPDLFLTAESKLKNLAGRETLHSRGVYYTNFQTLDSNVRMMKSVKKRPDAGFFLYRRETKVSVFGNINNLPINVRDAGAEVLLKQVD